MDVDSELPFVHLNEPMLRSIQKRLDKEGQKQKNRNFQVQVPRQEMNKVQKNRKKHPQLCNRPKKVPLMQFYQAGKSKLSRKKADDSEKTFENIDNRTVVSNDNENRINSSLKTSVIPSVKQTAERIQVKANIKSSNFINDSQFDENNKLRSKRRVVRNTKKEIQNYLHSDDGDANQKTKNPSRNKKSKLRLNKKVVTRANPYNRELYDPDAVEVQKLFESEKYLPEEENQVEKHHSDNCGNSPEVPCHNTNEENSVTSMAKGIINRSNLQQDQGSVNTAVKKKTIENLFNECELMRLTMKTYITPDYAGTMSLIYSFENFNKSRNRLIEQYKKIVLKDLKFAYENKVDNKLWQDVFYKVLFLILQLV